MCDFHSILGIAIGGTYSIRHDPSNSHSGMTDTFVNQPNRVPVIFEAECSADLMLATDDIDSIKSKIIRNYGECPEALVREIVAHYRRVKEALTGGKHLAPDGYFADTAKWADVWNAAISRNVTFQFPAVFQGNLEVSGTAKLDAPALTEVVGNLGVYGTARLDALTKVGGYLAVSGTARLDALTKVGGYLVMSAAAKLDAPALTEVVGYLDVYGTTKLDALTKVGGYLDVSGTARLDAPALTEVVGNLGVYGTARLDALTKVGGYLDVSGTLIAPKLNRI